MYLQDPGRAVVTEEVPEIMNASKSGEAELRKDLKKARHMLRQYETKIKAIEEEHRNALAQMGGPPKPDFSFKAQFDLLQKQVGKERQVCICYQKDVSYSII